MDELLHRLQAPLRFSGDPTVDAIAFLQVHGAPAVAAHSSAVAEATVRIARRFGADEVEANLAALLHDVGGAVPNPQRVEAARRFGLAVLPEEERLPLLLHQRLSAVFARTLFGVTDLAVLSAIGCHTTLKRGASLLDTVLFVADKLSWDQPGEAPFRADLDAALSQSPEAAARIYIDWLRRPGSGLQVVHPWLREAYADLTGTAWEA